MINAALLELIPPWAWVVISVIAAVGVVYWALNWVPTLIAKWVAVFGCAWTSSVLSFFLCLWTAFWVVVETIVWVLSWILVVLLVIINIAALVSMF